MLLIYLKHLIVFFDFFWRLWSFHSIWNGAVCTSLTYSFGFSWYRILQDNWTRKLTGESPISHSTSPISYSTSFYSSIDIMPRTETIASLRSKLNSIGTTNIICDPSTNRANLSTSRPSNQGGTTSSTSNNASAIGDLESSAVKCVSRLSVSLKPNHPSAEGGCEKSGQPPSVSSSSNNRAPLAEGSLPIIEKVSNTYVKCILWCNLYIILTPTDAVLVTL